MPPGRGQPSRGGKDLSMFSPHDASEVTHTMARLAEWPT
jgi:hypothetical protein